MWEYSSHKLCNARGLQWTRGSESSSMPCQPACLNFQWYNIPCHAFLLPIIFIQSILCFLYVSLLPPSFSLHSSLHPSCHAYILSSALLSPRQSTYLCIFTFSPSLHHSLFPCPSSPSFLPPSILYDRNLLKKKAYSPFLPTWDVAFPYYAFLHP